MNDEECLQHCLGNIVWHKEGHGTHLAEAAKRPSSEFRVNPPMWPCIDGDGVFQPHLSWNFLPYHQVNVGFMFMSMSLCKP